LRGHDPGESRGARAVYNAAAAVAGDGQENVVCEAGTEDGEHANSDLL